jgi:hypothetical protein
MELCTDTTALASAFGVFKGGSIDPVNDYGPHVTVRQHMDKMMQFHDEGFTVVDNAGNGDCGPHALNQSLAFASIDVGSLLTFGLLRTRIWDNDLQRDFGGLHQYRPRAEDLLDPLQHHVHLRAIVVIYLIQEVYQRAKWALDVAECIMNDYVCRD